MATTDSVDCAVMMACDANYLPFALHLAWQIASRSPDRRFDLLIVMHAACDLPPWATAAGIRLEVVPPSPPWSSLDPGRFGPAVYLPFQTVKALTGRYRRILALDSDVWFEGGDLDRLLRLDLGPHPLGAVRDAMMLSQDNLHAPELKRAGLGPATYFNSGVLLYDTAAWAAQDWDRRCLDVVTAQAGNLWLADQSVLNIAFHGRFAELSLTWNWTMNYQVLLATHRFPVHFRHFVGTVKPWKDVWGKLDARFHQGYADFFRAHLPEGLAKLQPRRQAPLTFREVGQMALDYLKGQGRITAACERFADDWDVLT